MTKEELCRLEQSELVKLIDEGRLVYLPVEEQPPFRNKHITVDGAISISGNPRPSQILCIVTNDDLSKTLTVVCAGMQIIIPFEKLAEYLK